MTKTNKEKILKWRLSEKPTAASLQDLVKSEILTKEEARQILLDETEYNSRDFDDVLEELKLLRKIVLELASRNPQPTLQIIDRLVPYYYGSGGTGYQFQWLKPYIAYCGTAGGMYTFNEVTNNAIQSLDNSVSALASGTNIINS